MREQPKSILDKFCIDFCKIVENHCKYIIVSGFVAISSGRVRGTEDIDMIIEKLSQEKFKALHQDMIKNNFVCMQSSSEKEIYSYLKDNLSLRYTYKNKPLPEMEVKFAKDFLDDYQIRNRVKLKITGLDIWFSSIETNIAFKEELLKSDKDLEDAEHLRSIFSVNEEEIKSIKQLIKKLRLK